MLRDEQAAAARRDGEAVGIAQPARLDPQSTAAGRNETTVPASADDEGSWSDSLPMPRYRRPPGPATIESSRWRPTGSPSTTTRERAKRRPSNPE